MDTLRHWLHPLTLLDAYYLSAVFLYVALVYLTYLSCRWNKAPKWAAALIAVFSPAAVFAALTYVTFKTFRKDY